MSAELKCPECGAPLKPGAQFCDDCGASIPQQTAQPVKQAESTTPAKAPVKPQAAPSAARDAGDGKVIDIGEKANIMGSINTTSTNTRNTTNNLQTNTTTNTSSIDNSSNVQNNTTIVMNGEKVEFCQVCGNPFGESHARCPKCGKQICFDCRVKDKNRCVECEKKAMEEYRISFQQLLLSTGGDIGKAGRQMMDQKARELNVTDSKSKIEAEFADYAKPQKAAQQQSQPEHKQTSQPMNRQNTPQQNRPQQGQSQHKSHDNSTGEKRINVPPTLVQSSNGNTSPSGKKSKGSSSIFIIIAVVIALAAAAYFIFGNKSESPQPEEKPKTENTAPQAKPAETAKPAATAPATSTKPKPVTTQQMKPVPAKQQTDKKYEEGMAAYNAGKGQEAIKAFTASGSAESNYMLGVIYKNGCGAIGKNEMMARKFFKKAASMGHEGAKAEL